MLKNTLHQHPPVLKKTPLRPNMKAVSGSLRPFLAVSAFHRVLGAVRDLSNFTAVYAPIKNTTGGWFCPTVDLTEFNMLQSSFNIPFPPVPPFIKRTANTRDEAIRGVIASQSLKISGGQHE